MKPARTYKPAGRARSGQSAPKRRPRRVSWRTRGILAAIVIVAAIFAWAVLARALAPRENTEQSRFDTLIVLGNPVDRDGNPTPIQQTRVTEAVTEYERGVAPHIIITGAAVDNYFVESEVMARMAEAQGIPAGAIIEETQARNTIENACDSLRVMRSRGWQSAEVITSPFHAQRAAMIFSQLPLKWRVQPAPPVVPQSRWFSFELEAMEILKTAHYLLLSRQTEPCRL